MYSVVIVDDEQGPIRSLKAIMSAYGPVFRVAGEAQSGARALSLIGELKPDLVITDIRMPGMDGLELIRRVREMDVDIRFVVISGYADFDYARSALKLGVVDYLLKPIVPADVRTALRGIADCLGGADSRSENRCDSGYSSRIAQAVSYIEREYANETLSIRQVAEVVRLSSSHFGRCFREQTGTTYGRFLNACRMKRAVELLADPSLRINEISSRCGYSGYVPFSKAFKRFHGCSPTEYRRKHRVL